MPNDGDVDEELVAFGGGGVEFGGFEFCDGGLEFLLFLRGDFLEAAGCAAGDYLGVLFGYAAEFLELA